MTEGKILRASTYDQLLASSQGFQNLVNAHNDSAGSDRQAKYASSGTSKTSKSEIQRNYSDKQLISSLGDQLIQQEEREIGDTGFKPYIQYLNQNKGFLYFSLAIICHAIFIVGQIIQNYWLAAYIQDSHVTRVKLIAVFSVIGCILVLFLLLRSFYVVLVSYGASQMIFSKLMTSLISAPMSFYDSTPLGRILIRVRLSELEVYVYAVEELYWIYTKVLLLQVSSDLSAVDLDVAFKFSTALGSYMLTYSGYGILAILTWPVLFVIIPMVYLTVLLQVIHTPTTMDIKIL
jgi:ATP-binding cassette subfamily C (CFTR/MRP) protein 2